MEDSAILDLYWDRNEDAIRQTEVAYGAKLQRLAQGIVESVEDAQECVSDTYLKAWNTIPPQRPNYFFAYLAKICRFLCFGLLDRRSAAKRKAEVVTLTAEMELCIPDERARQQTEGQELGKLLDRFLEGLNRENRVIFLRRYWFADSVESIARRYGFTESKVKTRLYRTRTQLRQFLEKEGIKV